jgi:nucleotide-binding universal stress UspA family protein
MTYAAVLTHVQTGPDAVRRLDCALEIAKRFDAAVLGVGAEMIPPLLFDGGFYSLEADWTEVLRANIDAHLKASRTLFAAVAHDLGDRAIWSCSIQLPCPAVSAAARAADLIVTGAAPLRRLDPYCDAAPGELALTSGRPVLMAPSHARPLVADKILLSWKDGREARRAMADAMPFLEQAKTVFVVAVCDELGAESAKFQTDDVAASLRRRGVAAEAKVVVHPHPDAHQLLRQASLLGADLVVSGAYGHTRLGEWVFGGFTRDLLAQDDVYLLLSH